MISVSNLYKNKIKTPDDILELMSDIKYDDFTDENKYIVKTPQEVLNKKLGICYDEVELERLLFKKIKYEFKTFFSYQALPVTDNPTHTYLIFKENNKYYWFENSWASYKSIHGPFNSYKDGINYVSKQLITSSKWNKVNTLEYTTPPNGLNINQFGNWIINNGKKI